jgi:threonyl-tRNA synthetase
MSLEFVIIPISEQFEKNAYDIKSKLITTVNISVTVEIDLDYDVSLNKKIMKWKRKNYDIIIVDHEFIESNRIIMRFADFRSRPKTMELDEFIDLVASFEHNDSQEKLDDSQEKLDDSQEKLDDCTNSEEGGCSIM